MSDLRVYHTEKTMPDGGSVMYSRIVGTGKVVGMVTYNPDGTKEYQA